MLKTLQSYLPSFAALVIFSGLYTALVFVGAHESNRGVASTPIFDQSQNFKVAKKLSAEKPSTVLETPAASVASPLETE